jgi:dienelactone hydrolase
MLRLRDFASVGALRLHARAPEGALRPLLVLSLVLASACAHATKTSAPVLEPAPSSPSMENQIGTQELTYEAGDTQLKGFLAFPATAVDKRPGVLIAHEWWGLNEHTKQVARKVAELGYVALAIDMYGNGNNSEHPADAKGWMMAVMQNPQEGEKRFEAGKAALLADAHVDPTRVAAMGYCMGGALVLQAARRGDHFRAVAVFHGNYATEAPLQKGKFDGKIFIAHGEADSFSTPEQVAGIKKELDDAGVVYELVSYPNAKHGFTNPQATELGQKNGLDLAYDAEADKQSWAKLQDVLAHAFN